MNIEEKPYNQTERKDFTLYLTKNDNQKEQEKEKISNFEMGKYVCF